MAYNQGIRSYESFAQRFNIAICWPIHESIIPHFVADLSLSGKAFATVKNYLAGISAKHKINGWPDPTKSFLVSKLLNGLSRAVPSKDTRRPITVSCLKQIVDCLTTVCCNTFEADLFKALFSVTFFGFFRVSELLGQSKSMMGGRPAVQLEDVEVTMPKASIRLLGSKTDQQRKGHLIVLDHVSSAWEICPVLLLLSYLTKRPGTSGPLFVHLDGSQVTRYQFQAVLKKSSTISWLAYSGFCYALI